MVGEEVIDELSLMELLLTMPGDVDEDDFGPGIGADLFPIKFSDILGGRTGAIFPDCVSTFWAGSVHLQPVAVHL